MNITEYLSQTDTRPSDFAKAIKVSDALLYQWTRNIRPVAAKHCSAIEIETNHLVSRKDLRPDDWQAIWPELAEKAPA